MKLSSLFYSLFLMLFVAPVCAATRAGECPPQDLKVQKVLVNKLFRAIHSNDIKWVRELINEGVDVNMSGISPAFDPIFGWRAEIDRVLLERKERLPLYEAILNNRIEIIELLLGAGANANVVIEKGITPLLGAIIFDNVEMVRLFIGARANVNLVLEDGKTPLFKAVEEDQVEIVRLLLDAGANVDATMDHGITPLMVAARNGCLDNVNQLIIAGANTFALRNAQLPFTKPIFDVIDMFFANPSEMIEKIKEMIKKNPVYKEQFKLFLTVSVLGNRKDLVDMLVQAVPEEASNLKSHAYMIAKKKGVYSIANAIFTLRELAKERVKALS